MNILFVSALEGGKYSGPLYSVPKQIESQAEYDNIYWVNLTDIPTADRFDQKIYHYCSLRDFNISKLPAPFNRPEIIVFEEFFKVECCLVARQAEKLKIPYVVIPRCQMTEKYLENKKIKKIIASILLFSHFAKKATAVQFLSEQEKQDSLKYYKGPNFIAPNGITLPAEIKAIDNKEKTVGVFIGRYSIWQKGLDLLVEAIALKKQVLKSANIVFELYGPNERTGAGSEIEQLVNKFAVEDIVRVNGPVFDNDKKNVLLGADFFVHTSRFEGMPMSVLEALSYGVPCFVTQGSNLRESVDEYDAGWGVDDSVESIAAGLDVLISEKLMIKKKSKNALLLAEKYSWNNIARESHEYLAKITNKR